MSTFYTIIYAERWHHFKTLKAVKAYLKGKNGAVIYKRNINTGKYEKIPEWKLT